jgi:hypothetical protein
LPINPDHANGRLNYWVAIDVAAAALGTTTRLTYKLARKDKWRHTPTKPRAYLMQDIQTTAKKRKANHG